MPPKAHAFLSASSSDRWIHCPPSARLCESVRDKGSDYAAEGTDAHSLCEHKLKSALGIRSKDPTEDLSWYDAEMEDCASEYASYIMELVAEVKKTCSDPIVLIEQRLDFSRYVPDGFGTGDCLVIGDGTLYVIDFKYGKGVEVSAENNPQMMCYSLGALELFDDIYDIDAVCMTIFQPRRSNISSFTIPKAMTTILCYFMLICVATLCISLVAGTIQSMYDEYKRDKRAEAQEKRDTEYHRERMKREQEQAAHNLEYHEKRMKELE